MTGGQEEGSALASNGNHADQSAAAATEVTGPLSVQATACGLLEGIAQQQLEQTLC